MNKQDKWDLAQLRLELETLFKQAGYVQPELQRYFDESIGFSEEIERLRKELRKRSHQQKPASDFMSSKLKDALRE
jgi:regulator of replication initiation timing